MSYSFQIKDFLRSANVINIYRKDFKINEK